MSVHDRIIEVAVEEWKFFGRQTWKDGTLQPRGHVETEAPYSARVGRYWLEGLNISNRDGNSPDRWSAAFVSWVMSTAGIDPLDFPPTASHSKYIRTAVGNRFSARLSMPFVGWRVTERALRPGDLLCFVAADNPQVTYENCIDAQQEGFHSHGDIVVAMRTGYALVIGGNVSQSVTLSYYRTSTSGFLMDNSRPFFVAIANNVV